MSGVEYKDLGLMWLNDNLTIVSGELLQLRNSLGSLEDPGSWYGKQIARVIKVKEQYVAILEEEIARG